jgi:putative mRNA 3-end processing factor
MRLAYYESVGDLIERTDAGLYCAPGDFYIDPWNPVERAVITHAHSDHAVEGSRSYLCARPGEGLLRSRLGSNASIQVLKYGGSVSVNGVEISLHPAGHILGSAQVRVAFRGEVWVVAGDYKLEIDPTCQPFDPVPCSTFVTESTFGLPIYRWRPQSEIFAAIESWWRANQELGKASVLFAYTLGKAQRLLAEVNPEIGPIYTHGAVEKLTACYRETGIELPPTSPVSGAASGTDWGKALILAPPSCMGSPWLRRFRSLSTAFASGWMRIRGARRRRSLDRGFVLSDHADWPGLLSCIEATGAPRVWVTHGYRTALARWLQESRGLEVKTIDTRFEGERDETAAEEDS